MKIAIISYGRADKVITREWLKRAELVVPERQKEDYEKKYKRVVAVPDKLDGNSTKKKNAVLNLYKGEDIVILDDDIKSIGYNEDGTGSFPLTEQKFIDFCKIAFNMTRELGTVLWGLNQNFDPLNYKTYSPFSLTSCALAPTLGFSKDCDLLTQTSFYAWLKKASEILKAENPPHEQQGQ